MSGAAQTFLYLAIVVCAWIVMLVAVAWTSWR